MQLHILFLLYYLLCVHVLVYYVSVSPTLGISTARFKLKPLTKEQLSNTATQKQISKLRTIESDINMILP